MQTLKICGIYGPTTAQCTKTSPWRRTHCPDDIYHILIVWSKKMFIQWVQSDLMSMKAAVNPERWGNWQHAEARMGLKLSDQPVITLSLETSKWMQELASKQEGEKGLRVSVAHLPQRSWYPQEGRNVPTKQTEVESQLFSPKTRGLDKITTVFTLETGQDWTKKAGCFFPVRICHPLATNPAGFHNGKMSFRGEKQGAEHTAARHWKILAAACKTLDHIFN